MFPMKMMSRVCPQSRGPMSRRAAALLLAAALLVMPAVAGAAPQAADATVPSWSQIWQGLTGYVASWFGWGGPDAVAGDSELGSTLDPDGQEPEDPARLTLVPEDDLDTDAELGSTLDPDG